MTYSLSKKEIITEILKCGKDPNYFINNYARISHPVEGLIPFKTYPYQTDLLSDFNDYRFTVILKARQLGISTIAAAYIVWMMVFHRDKNILVMATKFKTASNLVKKVKAVLKNLPDWLIIAEISIDNRASFELSNGSQIQAASTSGDAGRSEALSLLVIDEAAHVENLVDLWAGLYPTISTGGRVIALSTPNGVGNWFHKIYTEAEEGANDFHPVRLDWDVHPERDQAWFDKETRNMSKREIAQELECNFNTSGETVIHPEAIARMQLQIKEPKYRTSFDRNMWIWEEYEPECSYLLVADVARGDGADYSVFHVVKLDTMEVVAEYQGKPSLDMYSNILFQIGKEYGDCLLVVENVGIGISVLEKLIELEYPNIYYSVKGTHEFVESHRGRYDSSAIPGFTTSIKTRPLIVAKLEEFIRNKLITVYSLRFINELRTFIWYNGKPQAMRGYNDDLIMALAIACWVRDTALTTNQRDIEYKKACLNSIISVNTKLNTTLPGMEGYNPKEALEEKLFKGRENAKSTYEQYPWLIKG
tara:strand:+ start:5831 stop:7432 length:1602 start_codon:yes stop_codon:yes gene_type:complete